MKALSLTIPIPIATLLAVSTACSRKITGYDTQILFVGDSDWSAQKKFRHLTASGWEIKATRRAWTHGSYDHNAQYWGTEYTLQKPLYRGELPHNDLIADTNDNDDDDDKAPVSTAFASSL